jgi:hypothetical protein
MNIPRLPENTSPFLWGAAAGAVALAIVGFNWGGWVTGNSADKRRCNGEPRGAERSHQLEAGPVRRGWRLGNDAWQHRRAEPHGRQGLRRCANGLTL